MAATSHTRKDSGVLAETDRIRNDAAYFELSICGRHRVYPRLPSQTIVISTGAGANQWGAWTEIVPANVVPFTFNVIGLLIEQLSATGIYHIQVGDCASGSTPGANDVQGEIRFRGTAPIARVTELIPFGCREIAAGRRVMGRAMNDSGGDNIEVSVVIRRYIELSAEVERWPVFPW